MAEARQLASSFGLEVVEVSGSTPELTDPEESLHKSYQDVALVLGERQDQGNGAVHVTTRRIVWVSTADPTLGLAVHFNNITLHAISQSSETHQKPCIYMQLATSASDLEGEDEEDSVGSAELRMIPAESGILQDMFKSLCTCAALNPDSGQDDDDEDGEFFYDEEEVLAGAGVERAQMLEHLDSLLQMPRADELDELLAEDPQRFDDPDDQDGEIEKPNGHSNPQ